ncbi:ring-cleaving dioxygenase [Deinococcus yavapaiensis]|uniref:Glyoxalase family protein n=1 Tax=Deinococcus yavapaiensis KR-236 TaxID=694435 RepID=A0A318S774_9DEIO|nr:ring-cleaving dioxygenase [Deinococcus yavapaiensis]PYE53645.1 glyoxalase family protein [Deinococcus yavapaiensis KR-236]
MDLLGLHHVTAVTANASANHAFYTGILGMRLVKKTVNQDDTSAYHLFYADAQGSPGSDLTFFDWNTPRERRGTHSVARTFLRVAGEGSLRWWYDRLSAAGVTVGDVRERDGRFVLDFEDPEGQRLCLIDDGGRGEAHPWDRSAVPAERQIRGLGPVLLSVPTLRPTDMILSKAMNMRRVREYTLDATAVHVYEMGEGGPSAEVHIAVEPNLPAYTPGAGGVHHVAFRTPTDEQHQAWFERLTRLGIRTSGEIDRYYFRALYFREPNGILFEISTDGPGFATDEPEATMGERLALPPFLEPRRASIERGLKPL